MAVTIQSQHTGTTTGTAAVELTNFGTFTNETWRVEVFGVGVKSNATADAYLSVWMSAIFYDTADVTNLVTTSTPYGAAGGTVATADLDLVVNGSNQMAVSLLGDGASRTIDWTVTVWRTQVV